MANQSIFLWQLWVLIVWWSSFVDATITIVERAPSSLASDDASGSDDALLDADLQSEDERTVFESMPAVFGTGIDRSYKAHLQYLPNHLFLCGQDDGLLSMPPYNLRARHLGHHGNSSSIFKHHDGIIVPNDDLPVVLLVSRGACSFEQKARTAQHLSPKGVVRFVVVYDDRSRSRLVPMSATDPAGINITMFFVSKSTGLDLMDILKGESKDETESGGIIVTVDAIAPDYVPSTMYDNAQEWILAVMAGFFTFLACFGCFLVCVQAGVLPAETSRVFLERFAISPSTTRETQLLTMEEVERLPIEFFGEDDDFDMRSSQRQVEHISCAICIDDFEPGEALIRLDCGHVYHFDCVTPWLTERSATCPLCKADVAVPRRNRNNRRRRSQRRTSDTSVISDARTVNPPEQQPQHPATSSDRLGWWRSYGSLRTVVLPSWNNRQTSDRFTLISQMDDVPAADERPGRGPTDQGTV